MASNPSEGKTKNLRMKIYRSYSVGLMFIPVYTCYIEQVLIYVFLNGFILSDKVGHPYHKISKLHSNIWKIPVAAFLNKLYDPTNLWSTSQSIK